MRMKDFNLRDYTSIHFIGIGGVSMSALAKFCLTEGFSVSGSDNFQSESTLELQSLGIKVFYGHSAANVNGADLVVYTSAIADDNEELIAAKRLGVPILKRSELLGNAIKGFKRSIAVAGSHGKTTVTAMIASILAENGNDPVAFVGGECVPFGNFRKGAKDIVVAEACEYKKNFLDIKAYMSVVLNIDDDHKDSFAGICDECEAFYSFVGKSIAVVNADDANAVKIFNACTADFALQNKATYTADKLKEKEGKYSFDVKAFGKRLGRISLKIKGKHNVYNALASTAAALTLGVDFSVIKRAIENFNGVRRRNEYLGRYNGLCAYADYAHHPTEIAALFNCYKNQRIIAVFQPHTYSRTKYLLQDFVSVLSSFDKTVIYKTYAAREKYDACGDGKRLYEELAKSKKEIFYAEDINSLKEAICEKKENAKKETVYLFIGAGDIYYVAKTLIEGEENKNLLNLNKSG